MAAVAAKFSASHVESATTVFLADVQLMGAPWNICKTPDLELRSWSFAKSESLYEQRLGEAALGAALKRMSWFFVRLR